MSYVLILCGFWLLSASWRVLFEAQRRHELATTGPYDYIRHPQYLGFIIIIAFNAADDLESGNVYLTVTGSSAEAGDDGEVGRGNRVSGLITPYRPTMEAAAGKNPVSHVGKLYNVIANRIANRIVATMPGATAASCMLVSRIGAPVAQPAIVDASVATPLDHRIHGRVAEVVRGELTGFERLRDELVTGWVSLF